jgi:hypothetical protein
VRWTTNIVGKVNKETRILQLDGNVCIKLQINRKQTCILTDEAADATIIDPDASFNVSSLYHGAWPISPLKKGNIQKY